MFSWDNKHESFYVYTRYCKHRKYIERVNNSLTRNIENIISSFYIFHFSYIYIGTYMQKIYSQICLLGVL